jgi:hypothetical protein
VNPLSNRLDEGSVPSSSPQISMPGYQKSRWGMSVGEVKLLYPSARGVGDELELESTVADMPAILHFSFVEGRLARVVVDFTPRFDFNRMPAAPSLLLAIFDRLDSLLTQKYGHASADRSTGLPSPARASSEEKEAAVARGELWLSHDWEFRESTVNLTFAGSPAVYGMFVTYVSNELGPQLESREREEARREADNKGL